MARPESRHGLLDCHEDAGDGGRGEPEEGDKMDTLGWSIRIMETTFFLGVRINQDSSTSCRRSSTPSCSSIVKKSFLYRPNRRSTVIQFKQSFRSFRGLYFNVFSANDLILY